MFRRVDIGHIEVFQCVSRKGVRHGNAVDLIAEKFYSD